MSRNTPPPSSALSPSPSPAAVAMIPDTPTSTVTDGAALTSPTVNVGPALAYPKTLAPSAAASSAAGVADRSSALDTTLAEIIDRWQTAVIAPLKAAFVGRDEVIDLIALTLTAGEHLFLYGPPGTAKSALIRRFASAVQGRYFEYMLTRFSEPSEIFGPIDLAALRDGRLVTNTTGMLPEAEFVFLDELFNANSAILNNLLTVLNERVFRRGSQAFALPMLSLFSASNALPDNDALAALFDRFLLRCRVGPVPRQAMPSLLQAGWSLETSTPRGPNTAASRDPADTTPPPAVGPVAAICAEDLRTLAHAVSRVDLSQALEPYAEMVFRLRDLGIAFSDRRAVRGLRLVAASAILCGRLTAHPADLWVLRYVWDREEQIAPLAGLVDRWLDRQTPSAGDRQSPAQTAPVQRHPRAVSAQAVDVETLMENIEGLERQLASAPGTPPLTLTQLASLRQRATELADQCAWLADTALRQHLGQRAAQLLAKLG